MIFQLLKDDYSNRCLSHWSSPGDLSPQWWRRRSQHGCHAMGADCKLWGGTQSSHATHVAGRKCRALRYGFNMNQYNRKYPQIILSDHILVVKTMHCVRFKKIWMYGCNDSQWCWWWELLVGQEWWWLKEDPGKTNNTCISQHCQLPFFKMVLCGSADVNYAISEDMNETAETNMF